MSEKVQVAKKPEAKRENKVSQTQKTDPSQSISSPVEQILFLQRTIGNQAVGRFLKSGALQAKLKIGQPADIYEQEADRVADAVMRMQEPQAVSSNTPRIQRACPACKEEELRREPVKEEEEEELRRKETSGQTPHVTPEVENNINSMRGGGQPLPESVRAFFEPRFGHDFSRVRVHNDAKAAELAKAVDARAFTVGRDIVFGKGGYEPGKDEGQSLIAHELTHTLQQGTSEEVHRRIILGGKYYFPERDYNWIGKQYGSAMVEFLKSMHNDGKPPEFTFKNYAQMHHEIRVRSNAIKGMEKTATDCCGYPSLHPGGYLDPTYWNKLGAFHFVVKPSLPSGKSAADAIESIFQSGAGTELECNSMMVSVQYYAILKSIGRISFNKRFPGGSGIVIKPVLVKVSQDLPNKLKEENLYKRVTISGFKDLLPGDWVYFLNVPDYPLKHPSGDYTGEHALYIGGDKFSGLGLQKLTNDQMIHLLLRKYNEGLPENQKKELKDVPGIVPQVIRRPVVESYTP